MRLTSRAFYASLPLSAALLGICQPAHAGMLGWMDRTFTFREEQKPLVAPTRNAVPRHVIQPFYSPADHVVWSEFYTRKDLTPQDYLSTSASKVMRPPVPMEEPPLAAPQGPMVEGVISSGSSSSALDSVMIGDPGQGPGMMAGAGEAQLGRATEIGPARNDWRDGGVEKSLASRPGDYDYRLHDTDREPMEADGNIIGEALPPKAKVAPEMRNDPRYVDFDDDGKVTKYAVQPGDTLGAIAAQPAIYDKATLWPLIYSANRKEIGGKPSNLKKGQQLTIPRDYTDAQAKDAEKRAAKHR